jgi:hypothetical protein
MDDITFQAHLQSIRDSADVYLKTGRAGDLFPAQVAWTEIILGGRLTEASDIFSSEALNEFRLLE